MEKGRVRDVLLGEPADGDDASVNVPGAGAGAGVSVGKGKWGEGEEGAGEGGGGGGGGATAAEIKEQETRLRKTAQRGVVKLFNAVRAAQVKGEEAARKGGAAGRKKERVGEMSKVGFLELVAKGGKGIVEGEAKEDEA